MTNPYAPPQVAVQDIVDPQTGIVLADRGTRLGAAILDSIIFMAMVYAPLIVTAVVAGMTRPAGDETGATAMLGVGIGVALLGLGVWLWFTVKYVKRNGQSIGKKYLGIKVVRTDGRPISVGRLIALRNVLNGLISIIPLYGLIDSIFIFGEARRCLHDQIADTIVIKA
jgi:uncharacterized RDD family membrane protein YckC